MQCQQILNGLHSDRRTTHLTQDQQVISMTGETNLEALIKSMEPVLQPGVYVFATVDPSMAISSLAPRMIFEEDEGKTLILLRETAEKNGIAAEFPCRMITLNVHSALDAVGFLAKITNALAGLGMGVNPVSAFYHDHLFIPEDRADDAMLALKALSGN